MCVSSGETERERERERKRQSEREGSLSRFHSVCTEPDVGLDLTNCEIMT